MGKIRLEAVARLSAIYQDMKTNSIDQNIALQRLNETIEFIINLSKKY